MRISDQLRTALSHVYCLESFVNILNECFNENIMDYINLDDAIEVSLIDTFKNYEHGYVFLHWIDCESQQGRYILTTKSHGEIKDQIEENNSVNDIERDYQNAQ